MAVMKSIYESLQKGALPPEIDEKNIDEYEQEALRVANSVYSALEEALAAWDASPEKLPEFRGKAARYRMLFEALSVWERRMLLARGRKSGFAERVKLLEELADIFSAYLG